MRRNGSRQFPAHLGQLLDALQYLRGRAQGPRLRPWHCLLWQSLGRRSYHDDYKLPGWASVATSVYYRWQRYSFALSIQNLLDRRYISSAQSALTLNVSEQRKLTPSIATRF